MQRATSQEAAPHRCVKSVHGVRYQVKEVGRSVAFYTQQLGFTLKRQQLPAFANVSLGDLQILLAVPGRRARDRCPTGKRRSQGAGTASCRWWPISQDSSRNCGFLGD